MSRARLPFLIMAAGLIAASGAAHGQTGDTLQAPTEVLAVITREASAEVARLKVLDDNPALPRNAVTGLTPNWVSATFLIGASRLTAVADVPDVRDYTLRAAQKFNYALGGNIAPVGLINADNQAMGDLYETLYERSGEPGVLMPLQQRLDYNLRYLTQTPRPKRLVWWWCDALFMAPAVYTRMSAITGDPKYIKAMDVQWWRAYDRLWDADENLFARDERFVTRRSATGRKIMWSRGEGWVVAGLARVLEAMPADFPSRPRYIEVYRKMAARLITLQGEDGLWRSSLLDSEAFPEPETSGTALDTYALAFGVNHGLLDRKTYLPHVLKGWAGLNRYVLTDGILGQVQTAGDQPVPTRPETTTMYASGAFIMAGLEIMKLGEPASALPLDRPAIGHMSLLPAPVAAPPASATPVDATEALRRDEERAAVKALAFDPVSDDPDYTPPYPAAKTQVKKTGK